MQKHGVVLHLSFPKGLSEWLLKCVARRYVLARFLHVLRSSVLISRFGWCVSAHRLCA